MKRKRAAWWTSYTIISIAAAGMTGWSLYIVSVHFGVPWLLAITPGIVFDGIALACLYQASEAVKAGRSAAEPITATFALAGVSVYLNHVHAQLIHGGNPALALFAMPTVGLLLVSHISWSGTRAQARAERGEMPMRLPAFGFWGWALARRQAGQAIKAKAIEHVANTAPEQPVTMQRITVQRTMTRPASPTDTPPQQLVLPAPSKAELVRGALELLGPDATAKQVAEHVTAQHGIEVGDAYVRAVASRASRARGTAAKSTPEPQVGEGNGPYL